MIIGGLFGTLLMGATYAVSDIREVRYSNQAKSIAFTVQATKRLIVQHFVRKKTGIRYRSRDTRTLMKLSR